MIPLAKGAVGLLALGAAAGAGFGASYLHSEVQPQKDKSDNEQTQAVQEEQRSVSLSENRKWLNTENDTDKGGWEEKVSSYRKDGAVKLDGYDPEDGNEKKESNVKKIKEACKTLKAGKFGSSDLSGKLKQAEEWCSIKKKVKEMFNKNKFDPLNFEDTGSTDNTEWDKKFEERVKDSEKKFVTEFKSTSSSDANKSDDIKKMKAGCKDLMDKDVEAKKDEVALFEKWCTKAKSS